MKARLLLKKMNAHSAAVVVAALMSISSTGCRFEPDYAPDEEKQAVGEKAHWSYHGETCPAHWGDLDPAYSAAKDGKQQSPIDILTAEAEPADLPPLMVFYHAFS